MTAAALPYILAAGGTALQMKASSDANKERRGIINAQLARDEETAKKGAALVLEEGEKLNPQTRQENLQTQENQISAQQMEDLKTGAGGGEIGSFNAAGDAGNVSSDFVKEKAARAVTEGNRLTDVAKALAKTRSSGTLQSNEALSRADLAGDLNNLYGANANLGRASSNDASAVVPNQGLVGLGTVASMASMIGSGMAASGFGTSPSSVALASKNGTWATSGNAGIDWGKVRT